LQRRGACHYVWGRHVEPRFSHRWLKNESRLVELVVGYFELFRLPPHQDSSYTSHVPSMAAGVIDRLWSVQDLVALWEAYEQRRQKEQYK
jgi:hypothetical protein